MKILVIRFSSLGDIVLTLPVLESLRQTQNISQIDFLTKAQYIELVKYFPVDNVYGFAKEDRGLAARLKKQKYDTIIDLQKNPRSIWFVTRLGPKLISSYPKRRWRRQMMVNKTKIRFGISHTVDAYLTALTRLKIKSVTRIPRLRLDNQLLESGHKFLTERNLGGKVIGLCPDAKHREKRWPAYDQVASLLLQQTENSVIVFSETSDAFKPDLGIDSPRLTAMHNHPLDSLAAVMSHCNVVVANDSGLMHLAAALGIPVVAIFGPTHPMLGFAPLGDNIKIICDNVPCSPCSLHGEKPCRMPQKYCFENITPERIKDNVLDLLDEVNRSQILREAAR